MASIMIVGSRAESMAHFRGELIQEMIRLGHKVTACAPEKSSPTLEDMGAHYKSFPMNRTGLNPFQDFLSLCSFVRLFREVRPEVVLSYTIKPVIYGSLGAALTHVNTISSMITGLGSTFSRETLLQRLLGIVVNLLYRLGLCRNKVVFFQNPDDLAFFLRQGLVKESNQPTLINGSGVDLNHYKVLPLPQNLSFLMVGRLIRDKGVREYVEAARIVKRDYPLVTFKLAGRMDDNFMAIKKEELDGWVHDGVIEYLGSVPDIRTVSENASVCVLPSYREGTPRSVLEAMAMGRPIITTDVPGCRETVHDGVNGFLVPSHDPVALAEAIKRFIRQPDLVATLGGASRRIAEQKYDVRDVNRVILGKLELLQEALI